MKKLLIVALLATGILLTGCTENEELISIQEEIEVLKTEQQNQTLEIASLDMDYDGVESDIDFIQEEVDLFDLYINEKKNEVSHYQDDFESYQNVQNSAVNVIDEQLNELAARLEYKLMEMNELLGPYRYEKECGDNFLCAFQLPIIYGIEEYEINVYEQLEYRLRVFDIQDYSIDESLYTEDNLVFEEPGDYIVTFYAEDSDANISSLEVSVKVNNVEQEKATYLLGTDIHTLVESEKVKIENICIEYLMYKTGENNVQSYCKEPFTPLLSSWYFHTTVVDVELQYLDNDGNYRNELWALDTLIRALNDVTYVSDGKLHQTPYDLNDFLVLYAQSIETDIQKIEDGDMIASTLLSMSLTDYAIQLEVDEVISEMLMLQDDTIHILLFTVDDEVIHLYDSYQIFNNADDAIRYHSGYPSHLIGAKGPMSDSDVSSNPNITYITGVQNELLTVDDVLTYYDAPLEYAELWDAKWYGWNDVYIVLHIGDYYIGWYWL